MYNAYYSIIQYCPNPARAEVANLGVVLLCQDASFLDVKLAGGNDRIRRIFELRGEALDFIDGAKQSIEDRLRTEKTRLCSLDEFRNFAVTRGGDMRLTEPRFVKTENLEVELDSLFAEFVGGRAKRQSRKNPHLKEIDSEFRRSSLEGRIKYDEIVDLPVMHKQMRFPYAYQNGALNLILPHVFDLSTQQWKSKPFELAAEGRMIQRHVGPLGMSRKVIVIPLFKGSSAEAERDVATVFAESEIKTVSAEQVASFVDTVESEAH